MPRLIGRFSTLLLGACVASFSPSHFTMLSARSLGSAAAVAATAPAADSAVDPDYPGTAVARMLSIRERVKSLKPSQLSSDWEEARRSILWAGGLKDLHSAVPGEGYTGHSFNDYNHCDLTAMVGDVAHNENEGKVAGIHHQNRLGKGIQIASLTEGLGPGGSWSTCMIGCAQDPPADVAHIQFKSRIAFKLVWSKNAGYKSFVLVDDAGGLLNSGTPTGNLPPERERAMNYKVCFGSKYAVEADKLGEPTGGSPVSARIGELKI